MNDPSRQAGQVFGPLMYNVGYVHRTRRLPVPGHPRWVAHYRVYTRYRGARPVRVPVISVGRTRLRIWGAARRVRAVLARWGHWMSTPYPDIEYIDPPKGGRA